MYSSVILFGSGMALFHQTWVAVLAVLLMVPVLFAKAIREEHFLGSRFPDYQQAMANTRRFIPGLV